MKVKQFLHANQFILYDYSNADYDIECLQSYNSLVVKIKTSNTDYSKLIILGRCWDYSKTTSIHVYAFLEQYGNITFQTSNKRLEVEKMIDSGLIKYDSDME